MNTTQVARQVAHEILRHMPCTTEQLVGAFLRIERPRGAATWTDVQEFTTSLQNRAYAEFVKTYEPLFMHGKVPLLRGTRDETLLDSVVDGTTNVFLLFTSETGRVWDAVELSVETAVEDGRFWFWWYVISCISFQFNGTDCGLGVQKSFNPSRVVGRLELWIELARYKSGLSRLHRYECMVCTDVLSGEPMTERSSADNDSFVAAEHVHPVLRRAVHAATLN